MICPALNRTDIKVKKGAICRPPNQTCTTWSIRALPPSYFAPQMRCLRSLIPVTY
ncbi:hypothetical protein AC26_0201 [Escherichia coli 1-176-05_S3_C2]|nr:hypothetical protein AC26_0201 [Escherichia coli 1-176-05_S3_C2]